MKLAGDVARGYAQHASEGATHVGGIGEARAMGRLREACARDEVTRCALKAKPANVRPDCDAELVSEDVLEARSICLPAGSATVLKEQLDSQAVAIDVLVNNPGYALYGDYVAQPLTRRV